MATVHSIDRKKLPRDLAEYILKNEKDIRGAVLTVFTNDDTEPIVHHFAQVTTSDLAYMIMTQMVCFIQELAAQSENDEAG